jgi:hypothetical protein
MTVLRESGRRSGVLLGVLAAGAVALAGCSGGGADGSTASGTPSGSAASSSSGGSAVSCSGTSCSLTLTQDAATVSVLGTQVRLGSVQDGQASLTVAGRTASCSQGQSVSAGPLRLTCTTVTADRVTLTAGLGG